MSGPECLLELHMVSIMRITTGCLRTRFDPLTKPLQINRRRFLEVASGTLLSAPFILQGAQPGKPNRLAYDISRFTVTDRKLIAYEEQRRFEKVAESPRRLWVEKSGAFLVACAKGVVGVGASGQPEREFHTPSAAGAVCRDASGNTWVGTRNGIHRFDPSATQSGFWPAPNSQSWFTALDTDGDDVFAADSGNRVVLRYNLSGKILGRIGTKDNARNIPGIVLPSPYLDVRCGPDGLLRVNNSGRHCVELYTRDGDRELSWGRPGAGIEGFCGCCNPVALDTLPDGSFVTCEKGLPRVKVYSARGEFRSVVAGPESFPENPRHGAATTARGGPVSGLDAATGPDGLILVLDLATANVHVMQPKKS